METIKGTIAGLPIRATIQQDMTVVDFSGMKVRGRHARIASVDKAFKVRDVTHPDVAVVEGAYGTYHTVFGYRLFDDEQGSLTRFFNRVRKAQERAPVTINDRYDF